MSKDKLQVKSDDIVSAVNDSINKGEYKVKHIDDSAIATFIYLNVNKKDVCIFKSKFDNRLKYSITYDVDDSSINECERIIANIMGYISKEDQIKQAQDNLKKAQEELENLIK